MPSPYVPLGDIYDKVLVKLGYPKSRNLRNLIEAALSEDEAAVWLELPAAPGKIAAGLGLPVATVLERLDRMALAGVIRREPDSDGGFAYKPEYMIEPLCDLMMYSFGPDWDEETRSIGGDAQNTRIAELWHKFFEDEWYRFARADELIHRRVEMLGGPATGITFSVTPAWKALEKCGAEPPPNPNYDLRYVARQVKAAGKHIVAGPCSCKVRARKSDAPIWTCGSFHEDFTPPHWRAHPRPFYKVWDPDDWLEMMGVCEEEFGLVHVGLPPHLFDVCTCDTECCNIFTPLKKYAHCYEGVEKSPYRSAVDPDICLGHKDCVPRCRFQAITARKDRETGEVRAVVDPDRCTGCGQCVLGCEVGAVRLVLKETEVA